MSFFCMLWTPLVLFLWNSLNTEKRGSSGGIWAFILGTLVSVFHYLFYPFVKASGFGLSLWFHALVDIVFVPVALPFLVFALFAGLGLFGGGADPAKFVLSALIPAGVVGTIGWSGQNAPLYLVLVPLIWTLLALGVSFFPRLVSGNFLSWVITFLSIIVLAPVAAFVFQAFYGQIPFTGFLLLALLSIPALIALVTASLARRSLRNRAEIT
jgi:hypothetical protein